MFPQVAALIIINFRRSVAPEKLTDMGSACTSKHSRNIRNIRAVSNQVSR
jgi:hypothetical protein